MRRADGSGRGMGHEPLVWLLDMALEDALALGIPEPAQAASFFAAGGSAAAPDPMPVIERVALCSPVWPEPGAHTAV